MLNCGPFRNVHKVVMWMKVCKICNWNHKLYPELPCPEQIAHVGAVCTNLIIELPTQIKVVTKLANIWLQVWEMVRYKRTACYPILSSEFHSCCLVSCWFEAMSHWPHTQQTLKRLTASNVGSLDWNCNCFNMNPLMKFIWMFVVTDLQHSLCHL